MTMDAGGMEGIAQSFADASAIMAAAKLPDIEKAKFWIVEWRPFVGAR
jgi:hypothetical protein